MAEDSLGLKTDEESYIVQRLSWLSKMILEDLWRTSLASTSLYSLVPPPRSVNVLFYTRSLCRSRAADLHRKLKGSSMVWTWVLESSWAVQSGWGAEKCSHDCNNTEIAKLSFSGGINHLGGCVAVTHSGIHIPHVSLCPPLNWASAEGQTH